MFVAGCLPRSWNSLDLKSKLKIYNKPGWYFNRQGFSFFKEAKEKRKY